MKLENIYSELQSSFILLQFVHLSILHYTTIGQGRVGIRRKALPLLDPRQGTSASKPIVISDEIGPKMPKSIMEILRGEMIPPYLAPQNRLPPKPLDHLSKEK